MILSRKVRLLPNKEQEKQLWKSVGTARYIYNWSLNRQKENYNNGGKFISDNDLRKEITQLKKTEEFSWLKEVSNNVAKQSVKDSCIAYKRFFNKKSYFPKFKSKKRSKLSFYNGSDKLKIKENRLVLLEKIGWLKTNEQLHIDGKYSNPRISYDGKYWYLSVGFEVSVSDTELSEEVIGIDLGINELAVCSNGEFYKNINKSKEVKRIKKKMKRIQRSISRKYLMNKECNKYKKTKNIDKLELINKLLYRRLTNIRNNHLHQITNKIVKTKPSCIVIEDLNISGMMKNRHLSKAISEQKLYEFTRQLTYKSVRSGILLLKVGRFYPSSKLCSDCGCKKINLKLSDRLYVCIDCGFECDRDLNASYNLRNFGIKELSEMNY